MCKCSLIVLLWDIINCVCVCDTREIVLLIREKLSDGLLSYFCVYQVLSSQCKVKKFEEWKLKKKQRHLCVCNMLSDTDWMSSVIFMINNENKSQNDCPFVHEK